MVELEIKIKVCVGNGHRDSIFVGAVFKRIDAVGIPVNVHLGRLEVEARQFDGLHQGGEPRVLCLLLNCDVAHGELVDFLNEGGQQKALHRLDVLVRTNVGYVALSRECEQTRE